VRLFGGFFCLLCWGRFGGFCFVGFGIALVRWCLLGVSSFLHVVLVVGGIKGLFGIAL